MHQKGGNLDFTLWVIGVCWIFFCIIIFLHSFSDFFLVPQARFFQEFLSPITIFIIPSGTFSKKIWRKFWKNRPYLKKLTLGTKGKKMWQKMFWKKKIIKKLRDIWYMIYDRIKNKTKTLYNFFFKTHQ